LARIWAVLEMVQIRVQQEDNLACQAFRRIVGDKFLKIFEKGWRDFDFRQFRLHAAVACRS
jgi:hypothetical protein